MVNLNEIKWDNKMVYPMDNSTLLPIIDKKRNIIVFSGINNISDTLDLTKNDLKSVLDSWIWKTPEQINQIIKKIESWKKLSESEINAIDFKITSNNPALWIFDNLREWDSYESIIFTWVKWVNDRFSQNFTDSVLNSFKHELLKEYPWITPVWNDYKNFVLKVKYWNIPSNLELNKLLNKSYLYQLGLKWENLTDIPELKTISETWVIKWNSQEDIMYSLAETRSNLESKIHWESILSTKELVEKLESMIDDYSFSWKVFETTTDERWRTKYITEKWILYKQYTINKTWKTVIDRIPILDAKWNLNPKIIKLVRKNKIPPHLQIYKDVDQIVKSAIVNWEFIWPYVRAYWLKNWDLINTEFFNLYQNIKNKLQKWESIDKKELETIKIMTQNTYKNALDKDTFCSKINKSWELFFIDIAWMWDVNIQDFINKIKKYNSSDITRKKLLLNSWSYMTENFQNLMIWLRESIQKTYPWKKINYYIWWDEIWIFIEWASNWNDKIIRTIHDELDDNLLEWRITKNSINKEELKEWWKKLFEKLDKLTKYSKIIEERIDEAIQKIKIDINCKT